MRKLDHKNFRLVVTGPNAQPTGLTAEHRVVNGDLSEKPKRTEFDGTDFSQSVGDIWESSTYAVKVSENLA